MKVTINIPFTYKIGETGYHTGKTLETIEDCKAEVIAEIESGVLTEDEPYMEVEKPKPDFSQREITLLRLALHAYANMPTVTALEREELNVIRLKLLETELGVEKEKSILG